MKHDLSFVFTAAIVLAGVVAAFLSPASSVSLTPVANHVAVVAPAASPAQPGVNALVAHTPGRHHAHRRTVEKS